MRRRRPGEEGRLGEVREGRERVRGEGADRAREADDARVEAKERAGPRFVLRLDDDGHEDVERGDAAPIRSVPRRSAG